MLTLQHCLLCFKSLSGEACDNFLSPSEFLSAQMRNGEICHRFCTLVSRHLSLDQRNFLSEKTINTKWEMSITHACQDCVPELESYCKMYEERQRLKLEMEWKLEKISTLIRSKNHEGSYLKCQRELEQKLLKIGYTAEPIYNFQNSILEQVKKKRQRSLQFVKLENSLKPTTPCEIKEEERVPQVPGNLFSRLKQTCAPTEEDFERKIFTPILGKKSEAGHKQNKAVSLEMISANGTKQEVKEEPQHNSFMRPNNDNLVEIMKPEPIEIEKAESFGRKVVAGKMTPSHQFETYPVRNRKVGFRQGMSVRKRRKWRTLISQNPRRPRKILQCVFCHKTCPSNNALDDHLRSHIKEKPFMCEFCDTSVAAQANLIAHRRRHFQREGSGRILSGRGQPCLGYYGPPRKRYKIFRRIPGNRFRNKIDVGGRKSFKSIVKNVLHSSNKHDLPLQITNSA